MATNSYLYFLTALIPLFVGFIYYHPKTFANAWMKSAGLTEENLKVGNMALIFGLAYFFSLVLSFMLPSIIIHQSHIASLYFPESADKTGPEFLEMQGLMEKFATKYRTYSHGMVHAGVFSILMLGPILAINALFERRGWKYVLIHLGYWFITFVIMGAILCSQLKFEI